MLKDKLLNAVIENMDEDARERKPRMTMAEIWTELSAQEKMWISGCIRADLTVLALMPISKVVALMHSQAGYMSQAQAPNHTHTFSGSVGAVSGVHSYGNYGLTAAQIDCHEETTNQKSVFERLKGAFKR
jgi:hypothetical protein